MATKKQDVERAIKTIRTEDGVVELSYGVDVKTDVDLVGIDVSHYRTLNNCIKIKANAPNVHFIQFVTRQVPDIYELTKGYDVFLMSIAAKDELPKFQGIKEGELPILIKKDNEVYIYGKNGQDVIGYTKLDACKFETIMFPELSDTRPVRSEQFDISQEIYDEIKTKKAHIPQENKLQWGEIDFHYMTDSVNPKWKLDVTEDAKTVFYEDGGLSCKADIFVAMYDYPGGNFEPIEERATFCTFVIMNNKIAYLAQWSKQYNSDEIEFYHVPLVQRLDVMFLPCWAVKAIQNRFKLAESVLPKELIIVLPEQKTFGEMTKLEVEEDAQKYFLQPPDKWITRQIYPALFQPLTVVVPREEKSRVSFDDGTSLSSNVELQGTGRTCLVAQDYASGVPSLSSMCQSTTTIAGEGQVQVYEEKGTNPNPK